MAQLRDNLPQLSHITPEGTQPGFLIDVPTVTELVNTCAHTGIQYTIHAGILSCMHMSTHAYRTNINVYGHTYI